MYKWITDWLVLVAERLEKFLWSLYEDTGYSDSVDNERWRK
jgi:hypothetical protein